MITRTQKKAITYHRPLCEIRKNESVFEWLWSIVFHKDTCIRVSLLLEKDSCIFHTMKLQDYFCKVEKKIILL